MFKHLKSAGLARMSLFLVRRIAVRPVGSCCITLTVGLFCVQGIAALPVTIHRDDASQRYTFKQGESPVLSYNYGTVPVPEGVSGKYAVARSNYVHPLYGPRGEILTKDYSPDHPHHRALYWAWPEVTFRGETRDLHALQGVFAYPQGVPEQALDESHATLSAVNVWKWGGELPIVRESVTLRVHAADRGLQAIDFRFRFDALQAGVTVARRGTDHYGGFNLRLSPRTDQQIQTYIGKKNYPWPVAWAELTGVPPGGTEPVGMLILQSPANPEYPGAWVDYPNLNWLQPVFPTAGTRYALDPSKPLELAFRLVIRTGDGLKVPPADLFAAYTATLQNLPDPLKAFTQHTAEQSRADMSAIELALRMGDETGHRFFERKVLAQLNDPAATELFKRWACTQLARVGSDAAVPAMTQLLGDDHVWMQAADVLLSRHSDTGLSALRTALPDLPDERRAAVIHLLGVRRDTRALTVLTEQLQSDHAAVINAALSALGNIGTAKAASLLLERPESDAMLDACLMAARRLGQNVETAAALYRRVWNASSARPWHRAAALLGLAQSQSADAARIVPEHLASPDRHLRHAAARALLRLESDALEQTRSRYAAADTAARLALLNAWARRQMVSAEPEFLAALKEDDADVRAAAVRGLRAVGSAAAVTPLVDIALDDKTQAKEAVATLAQIQGADVTDALYDTFASDVPAKAALAIEVIGLRQPPGYLDRLAAVLQHNERASSREALVVLRNAGTPVQMPALREQLFTADKRAAKGLALAIVAICQRQNEPGKSLDDMLSAAPALTGNARIAMLSALPAIGGAQALDFVTKSIDEAAVRSLIKWPDAGASDALLSIMADSGTEDALRSLAAAGTVAYAKRVLPVSRQIKVLRATSPHLSDKALLQNVRTTLHALAMVNLARGKSVTSSHPHQGSGRPALAVDGNKDSYWGCATSPTSITVDLEIAETVALIRVIPYHGDGRHYQYRVDISPDNQNWTPAADMSDNTKVATAEGVRHQLEPSEARYVRVTMLKNSANPGMHIMELEVYGPATEEESSP